MRPAARFSAPAAVVAAALLLAGCAGRGDSSAAGPTRAEYLAQAKQICVEYQKQINDLKGASDLGQLADQGQQAIELEAAEVEQLRKLEPPAKDADAIERMLDAVELTIATARELVSAARADDVAGVTTAASNLRRQLAEANRLAKPFGLDLCAS
ncbi:MAG: hypothetical protein QOJ13_1657 [Gaiellales bacterium]|jgi:hypothetical protein|nr:hypothetical protein [Gaiellales bacterium]